MSRWSVYVPTEKVPWNLARVVHLHRRAGFAATWLELQRDLADGPERAVSRLLNGTSRSEGVPEDFEALSATISCAALCAGDPGRLKAWWIYRCLFTPDPLGERLTLMWHNHFATSLVKVTNRSAMHQQNQRLRQYARGEFGTLLAAMLEDPALLVWLDATENRPGHPNENLAREVLELFSLGIGHYSEDDIREAARALTGLEIQDGIARLDLPRHDGGLKTIFGKSGAFRPRDLLDLLISHPATSERLAWRLCREFCGENAVDPRAIKELADGLRANRLRIDWAVETILRSELFYDASNLHCRVADPASFLLSLLRALECCDPPPSTLALADALRSAGLDLFVPPNVGGWPGGRAWLSTRTVLARGKAIVDLAYGRLHSSTVPIDPQPLLERHRGGESLPDQVRFLGTLFWGDIDHRLVDELSHAARDEADRPSQLRRVLILMLTRSQAHLH